jgi:preprotein translocase subunit SecY
LGEQVTERGIGNGISILIFTGIVSGFPGAIGQSFEQARQGEISIIALLGIGALAMMIVAGVVFVERGQRRITVNYARRQQGRQQMPAQSSHLPLKVNMAGVIPAIFASSLLLFPASIGQWFGQSPGMEWLQDMSLLIAPGQPLNIILFSLGIIFFCFWYTAIMFNPKEVADNLKKSGAFIPGFRPGDQTARHIDTILTRLTLVGAFYMTAVCLLPQALILQFNITFQLGGTALLIVVVVAMDFMSQVQTHLMSHQYESLMKKSNLQNFGRR